MSFLLKKKDAAAYMYIERDILDEVEEVVVFIPLNISE
jgi:hypothetical protein